MNANHPAWFSLATYHLPAPHAIAAKLIRCETIAAKQRHQTMQEAAERGAGWTTEDFEILMNGLMTRKANNYETHRAYRASLNT